VNGDRSDVERTALDVRVDAEDRAGVFPGLIAGEDITAYQEVMRRVAAECEERAAHRTGRVVDANLIAIEVLTEAVANADGEWDPHVYIGSAAVGIVRALKQIGWGRA
jgi:hypothetical protein